MKVYNSLPEWKAARPGLSGSLGLVPTMGYLHEGHLSLVRRAREENDLVVAWIFVNPQQFGPSEDFERYPRDMERDLTLLREAKVDFVLSPPLDQVYPPGFQTFVQVEALSQMLEGASRPSHFRGVATVVSKLLCMTLPHRAYFGQKDGQQSLVVTRMVKDLDLPCEIVVCPTVREPDGLALSSRNVYLAADERKAAPVLYKALMAAEKALKNGETNTEKIRGIMAGILDEVPLAKVHYISLADAETLTEATKVEGRLLVSLAANFGNTRLIDNILFSP